MTLAEFHAALFDLTFDSGTRAAARNLSFAGPSCADSHRRIQTHRDLNFRRAVGDLGAVYSRTAAAAGEPGFLDMVAAYRAEPARRSEVRGFFRRFPEFLGRTSNRWSRPDLADLARLEWARAEVLDEVSEEPMAPEMGRRALERLSEARLRFIHASRVISLRRSVFGLWSALAEGDPLPASEPELASFLVWRNGEAVFHSLLDPCEARALGLARLGARLDRVLEAFLNEEGAVERAHSALAGWLDDAIVAAIDCGVPVTE